MKWWRSNSITIQDRMSAVVGAVHPHPMKSAGDAPSGRRTQRVIVTKRVRGSSALDPTLATDRHSKGSPAAVRLDPTGEIVPHSILGTPEEYVAASGVDPVPTSTVKETRRASMDPASQRRPTGTTLSTAEASPERPSRIWNDAREGRQLERWAEAGRDWERQENILTTKLGREPTNLMMNSEATFRRVKEKRDKLDIALSDPSAMHTFEQGKGFRVRSEYWTQAMVTKSGLQSTLTTRQRGDVTAADAFEYVGKPSTVLHELHQTGRPVGAALDQTIPFFHTPYLEVRAAELDAAVDSLFPHVPDLSGLEVVGTTIRPTTLPTRPAAAVSSPVVLSDDDRELAAEHVASSMASGVLLSAAQSALPYFPAPRKSVEQQSGPYLKIVGTDPAESGGVSRISFHTAVGAAAATSLVLENRGTTALIVSWKKVDAPNPLGKVEDNAQRFFFDHRPVTILPGARLALAVQFRTRVGGMFLEKWEAAVLPPVKSSNQVVFCGTATRDDECKPARDAMEKALEKALIRRAIHDMLHALITRIHPRNHEAIFGAPPPTLEERFVAANADLVEREGWTYSDRIVRDLQHLHARVTTQIWATTGVPRTASADDGADGKGAKKEDTPVELEVPTPEEWDLSVTKLKDTIMSLTDWDLPAKIVGHSWHEAHTYLAEMNTHALALTRMRSRDTRVDRRVVAREFISAMIAAVEAKCNQARHVCGIEPMALVAAEDAPDEEYVPRIQISPPQKGAKKGKPPPKDDKKKKPERQVQGKVPEPLDEATAAMLAPIQFRMAREAVVSAINDLETLLPLCD